MITSARKGRRLRPPSGVGVKLLETLQVKYTSGKRFSPTKFVFNSY